MTGYGQFCPLALAAEILTTRWTPLVLRELILGARRFNDIHRGVPRMSPSLLSQRLKSLEKAGIVERRCTRAGIEYVLTEAGRELSPLMVGLGTWAKRWLPATLNRGNADPRLILWDLHRRMNLDRMPATRIVIGFEFIDQPKAKRHAWIVGNSDGVELCITDPGLEIDLFVTTDSRMITWIWYGDMSLAQALKDGAIDLHGPPELCRAFPSWLQLSVLASVPRRHPRPTVAA
ncbi:MAG: helix-turn-helix transcriptional regulator [Pseudolabrys sp.]|nr:helix-turn-helix transcriptional regulator [Pseudolabrys sp.]